MIDFFIHVIRSFFALFIHDFVVVDVKRQRLSLFCYGKRVDVFEVSTARLGTGEELGSNKTPRGWFFVRERFGENMPLDTVFKGRKVAGLLSDTSGSEYEDPILARILRLSGLQLRNRNTFSRYVYIHGSHSQRVDLPGPLSMGCVNMRCEDIQRLFSSTNNGLWVYVVDQDNPLFMQPCFFDLSE